MAKTLSHECENVYQENNYILKKAAASDVWGSQNLGNSTVFSNFPPKLLFVGLLFTTVIGIQFQRKLGSHLELRHLKTLFLEKNLNIYASPTHFQKHLKLQTLLRVPHRWWWWLKRPLKTAPRKRTVVRKSRQPGGRRPADLFLWHWRFSHTVIDFWEHWRCAGITVEFLQSLALTGTFRHYNEMRPCFAVSHPLGRRYSAWKGRRWKSRARVQELLTQSLVGQLRWTGLDTNQRTQF